MRQKLLQMPALIVLAALLGYFCSLLQIPYEKELAHNITRLFMNALRLVSLPIIFLSISSTICGMQTVSELKLLGRRVASYTLATTLAAAALALVIYLNVNPAGENLDPSAGVDSTQISYADHVLNLIPSNFFQPFIDGNVMGVLLLAVMFGCALLSVERRATTQEVLATCLAAFMRVIRGLTKIIPVVVWAGVVESYGDLMQGQTLGRLARYLFCVVLANVLQATLVLPIFLRLRGISTWQALRGFWPALNVAFFSKSSVATLPIAIRCAEESLHVQSRVARFTFPICTTINMNGCAAFILTTVLFVSESHGRHYNAFNLGMWVLVATLAAVGNAGVPMGCYVLASALLAAMNVHSPLMALILPFYSLLDMLETAVNVWSDGCVALMVQSHMKDEPAPQLFVPGEGESLLS